MKISLETCGLTDFSQLRGEYDDAADDIRSILSDVCDAMAEDSRNVFRVAGFGDNDWPVDIRTDLPVFLEQLPDLLSALVMQREFVLDFYEQGIERRIKIAPALGGWGLECESYGSWVPDQPFEYTPEDALFEMVFNVYRTFVDLIEAAVPSLKDHPWFIEWEEIAGPASYQ